jgi:alpha-tubulin suppressor-like RCC1 family protein
MRLLIVLGVVACSGGASQQRRDDPDHHLVLAASPPPPSAVMPHPLSVAGHGCVVDGGRVACWGYDHFRQLGHVAKGSCNGLGCETTACWVDGVEGAVAVAAGEGTTCTIDGHGAVTCWGEGHVGQLGPDPTEVCGEDMNMWACTAHPTPIAGLHDVVSIVVDNHACALAGNGEVWCWGANTENQLGSETSERCPGNVGRRPPQRGGMYRPEPPDPGIVCSRTPVRVPGVTDAVQLAIGSSHTCALLRDGTVTCWGDNTWGQLGRGPHPGLLPPAPVDGLDHIVGIAGGTRTTCAWQRDGHAWCWGANNEGELAYDTTETCQGVFSCSSTPRPSLDGVAEISIGFTHACARKLDGTVVCWGLDAEGALGSDGHDTCGRARQACAKTPQPVPGITAATSLSVGEQSSCVIDRGEVRCWGRNVLGGLGDGTTQSRKTPAPIVAPRRCST